MAIFLLHFATTGVVVMIRAAGMSKAILLCTLPKTVHQRSLIVLMCLVCCPVSILVVVLLDTLALTNNIFVCIRLFAVFLHARLGCLGGLQVKCCPAVCVRLFELD